MEQSGLVRLLEQYDVEIEWHGFELHPETPEGGVALSQLFRGVPIEKIRRRMARFGAEFGVEILVPQHLSNTRRALAMSEYARDQGRLEAFRQQATTAYWTREADLENDDQLRDIANRAGLNESEALGASLSPVYVERVLRTRERGIERGVTGVPTLFMGGMPVVGCQRYETFEMVAVRAGAVRR